MPSDIQNVLHILFVSGAPFFYYLVFLPMWWLAGEIAALFVPEYSVSYIIFALAFLLLQFMLILTTYHYALQYHLIYHM